MLLPNTAVNLKESKRNSLKDFVAVAGPLGVTHFVMLTASDNDSYLRVAKTPRVRLRCRRTHGLACRWPPAGGRAAAARHPCRAPPPPLPSSSACNPPVRGLRRHRAPP